MKKILCITLLCFITKIGWTQAVSFEWGKQIGGADSEWGYQLETDDNGNVITVGRFKNIIDFDPGVGIYTLNAPLTSFNAFIQKLDSNGNFIWAKKLGDGNSTINTVAIGTHDAMYCGGGFSGTVDFDPGIGVYNLTSSINMSFILKLDSAGNFLWVKTFTGSTSGATSIGDIKLDHNFNLYVSGLLGTITDFDPSALIFTLSATNPGGDMYIAKYDSNGNFIWAKGIVGSGSVVEYGIDLDSAGSIYSTGYFSDTIDFDPGPAVYNLIHSGSYQDIFISKLDSNGNFVWAKHLEGTSSNIPLDIVVQNNSYVYAVCFFGDTLDCDPGPLLNQVSSFNGSTLILKLNLNGDFVWANQIGAGTTLSSSSAIALDFYGNLYIAGRFQGTADLDPGTAVYNLSSPTVANLFILKTDVNGSFVWVQQIESNTPIAYGERITSMQADTQNIHILGQFQSAIDLDPGAAIYNLTPVGYVDLFIEKLKQCISSSSILKPSACESFTIGSQTYTSSGTYTQQYTNAIGCDSIVTIELTIHGLPNTLVTQSGTTLSAIAAPAFYQWINCAGNTLIPGATNQSYTATANGNYAVIITMNNCIDTSTCYLINNIAIIDIQQKTGFTIYPNPVSKKLYIKYANTNKELPQVELYNSIGQLIFTTYKTEIDMSIYDNGIYFFKIENEVRQILNE